MRPRRPARPFKLLVALAGAAWVATVDVAPTSADEAAVPYTAADFAGSWTYRSFHNDPQPVEADPQQALALFFAEAAFMFDPPAGGRLAGVIDWGSGGLDLEGDVTEDVDAVAVRLVGTGRPGTQTEGWRYDYDGRLARRWPNGVEQIPSLVGTVIRVNPHGPAKAGYVASFIAVKRP